MSHNNLNIVLLGKTGHGKSSTGNTLAGQDKFGESDSANSATDDVNIHCERIGIDEVKIIDTPGMRDTRSDRPSGETARAVDYMRRALDMCNQDIHLFVLVLPYGARYTKEESKAITDIISTGYGDKMLSRCMIVFTHGDDFWFKYDKNPQTFQDWCQRQSGAMRDLFQKVDFRVQLIENLRADDRTKTAQRDMILEIARNNRSTKGAFTYLDFKEGLSTLKVLLRAMADLLSCNIL